MTVDDDTGATPSYTLPAALLPASTAGGTANPLCGVRCLDAGFCALGQVSSCAKPSCNMGCILAARTATTDACTEQCELAGVYFNASCNEPTAACNQGSPAAPKASGFGCDFVVPSPAAPHHAAGEALQNESFSLCADREEGWSSPPVLTNGTECTTCNGRKDECALGCGFGATTAPAPATWKVLLRPTPAGGSYTITIKAAGVDTPLLLRRITFGEVYFCSGQSNMVGQLSAHAHSLPYKIQPQHYMSYTEKQSPLDKPWVAIVFLLVAA